MRPDKKVCLNCGKEIDGKKTYCDDACRMAYKRNPNKQPEQIEPEHEPEHDLRSTLTKTDKTFYDRAMRDFNEPYYIFTGNLHEAKCGYCNEAYKTRLSLNKYCSYDHYSASLRAVTK